MSKAKNSKALSDLMSRAQDNADKAQSQGGTLTPAQSLAHEIDKLRDQNKAKSISSSPAATPNISPPLADNDELVSKTINDLKAENPSLRASYNDWVSMAKARIAEQENAAKAMGLNEWQQWNEQQNLIGKGVLVADNKLVDGWVALAKMIGEIADGTREKRLKAQIKADAKAKAETEKVRQEYQSYMRSIGHKGYVLGGNNMGIPSMNTMSENDK